jgi:hypothetical protein
LVDGPSTAAYFGIDQATFNNATKVVKVGDTFRLNKPQLWESIAELESLKNKTPNKTLWRITAIIKIASSPSYGKQYLVERYHRVCRNAGNAAERERDETLLERMERENHAFRIQTERQELALRQMKNRRAAELLLQDGVPGLLLASQQAWKMRIQGTEDQALLLPSVLRIADAAISSVDMESDVTPECFEETARKIKARKTEYEKAVREYADLDKKTRDLQEEKEKLEKEHKRLVGDVATLKDDISRLERFKNSAETEIDSLKKTTITQSVMCRIKDKSIEVLRGMLVFGRPQQIVAHMQALVAEQQAIIETKNEEITDLMGEVGVLTHERDARGAVIDVLAQREGLITDVTRPADVNGVHAVAEALLALAPPTRTMAEKMATLAKQESHLAALYKPRDTARMTSTTHNQFLPVFLLRMSDIIMTIATEDTRKDLLNKMFGLQNVVMRRDVLSAWS